MTLWTGTELTTLFGGNLPSSFCAYGVSIDSRTAQPGDIFVAIKGPDQDGHHHVKAAVKNGCVAVIVDHLIPEISDECHQIVVKNTLQALTDLGRAGRQRSKAKIIAITGSVGKTSTKEMVRHTLQAFGETNWSQASYNNHWGVPLSLARLHPDADFGVFEIGMNHPGEIEPLAKLVNPDVAVMTVLAPAHIGQMGSLDAIAKEKTDIFSGLKPEGTAVICSDNLHFEYAKNRAKEYGAGAIIAFGTKSTAQCVLKKYTTINNGEGGELGVEVMGDPVHYKLSVPGKHQAVNSLVCLAIGKAFNLNIEQLVNSFSSLKPIKGRGMIHQIRFKSDKVITLIDDAYNANVVSMKAGLETLSTVYPKEGGRRIVVFGEMLELENQAKTHHQEIAITLNKLPIDSVYVVGGTSAHYGFSCIDPSKQGGYVQKSEDLRLLLESQLQNNDVVLIKGSKGSRVSLLVEHLVSLNISTDLKS